MGTIILVIVIGIGSIVVAKCIDCKWGHGDAYNWQKLIIWGIGSIVPMIVIGCISFSYDVVNNAFQHTFSLCWAFAQPFLFILVYCFKDIVEWLKSNY